MNPKSHAKPDVSVVMGVYNAAGTVTAAIESILEQKVGSFEFVIVDDGSTDRTPAILDEFALNDARVRVLRQENRGLTRALIRGCAEAQGEFIARQDADDVSPATRLGDQLSLFAARTECVLVTGWVADITADGHPIQVHKELSHSIEAGSGPSLQMTGIAAHGSVMIRRSAYSGAGGYRECFHYAQDSDLWLRLWELGPFGVVKRVVYRRVVSPMSISFRHRKPQARFCELAQQCFRARLNGESEDAYLQEAEALAQRCRNGTLSPPPRWAQATSYMLMGAHLAQADPANARQYYLRGLRTWPLHLRCWKAFVASYVI